MDKKTEWLLCIPTHWDANRVRLYLFEPGSMERIWIWDRVGFENLDVKGREIILKTSQGRNIFGVCMD